MLDVPTLFFCTLIAQAMLVLMLVVVFWGRFRDGLLEWSIAGAAEVAGWVLFLSSDLVPAIVSTSVAVALLSLCLSLSRVSLKRFFHDPVAGWEIWALPLVCFVQQTLWLEDGASRIVFANLMFGSQAVWCCWPLFKQHKNGTNRSRWLLIGAFTVFAFSVFARAALTAWSPESMPDLRSASPVNVLSMLTSFLTVILINVGLLMLHQDRAWFQNLQLALTDPLTGLLNRRALMEAATREVANAHRHDNGLVVMMLDLDYFKKLNDSLGHPEGDKALRLFANCIQEEARQTDLVARYGGEEFCVLLTRSKLADAEQLTQRIRKKLAAHPLQPSATVLRFSAGASPLRTTEDTLDAAIARADGALYQAKATGRNRTVLAPEN